jgi:hypothetical protein
VLNFIYGSKPELRNYKPAHVQRQLVNGYNYRVDLEQFDGCFINVTVYASFQGSYALTDPGNIACPGVVIPNPTAGGYKVQPNPAGD